MLNHDRVSNIPTESVMNNSRHIEILSQMEFIREIAGQDRQVYLSRALWPLDCAEETCFNNIIELQ